MPNQRKRKIENSFRNGLSEDEKDLFLNLSQDLICISGLDGYFKYLNPVWEAMLGYTIDELLSRPFLDFIHPDDHNKNDEEVANLSSGNMTTNFENRYIHKDGSIIHISWKARLQKNEETIYRIGRDITERKQVEDKLKRSEQSLQETEQIGKLGHVDWVVAEQRSYWSDEVFRIYERESELGVPVYEEIMNLHTPEDAKKLEALVIEALQNGTDYDIDLTAILPSGRKKFLHIIGKPVKDENSSVTNIKGIVQDITKRKQAENELLKTRERLQFALEGSQQGMWDWNIPSGELIYNGQWAKLFGYKPDEVEPTVDFFLSHVHPKDLETVEKRLQLHLDQKAPIYESEHRMLRKGGEVIWTLDRGKVTERDHDGNPLRVTGLITDISKAKQAEEKLKESEDNLKNTFDLSPSIIAKANLVKGYFIEANKAVTKILGYTVEEFTSKPFIQLIHPDDQQNSTAEKVAQIKGKEVTYFENRYLCKDGSYKWIAWFGTKADKNGIVTAIGSDITEKKQAEEILKESESRYKQLVETASDAIYLMDEYGIIIDTNKTATKLLKKKRSEVIGKSIDTVDPNFPVKEFIAFWETIPFNEQQIFETTHITGDGKLIPIEISAKKFKLRKKTYYYGIGRDITERKQAEEKLKESEERFNLAMNASNDGLFDWNLETNEIYYSPAWKKMLGYEDHELPNDFSVWEKTTAPEDVKKSWELQQKLISKQIDRFELEFKMKHKEGHWVDILSRAKAVFDESGKAIRIVGTHTDITERKKAEEELFRASRIMSNSQEIAHLGSFEYVAATQTTIWSEEEYRIYGLDPNGPSPEYNEMLEKCIHPDDAKLLNETFMMAIKNQGLYELEHRIVRPDGSIRWVHDKAHPYFDEKGNLLRYVGATLDITERKQFIKTIQERNEYIESILENMPIGFALNTIDDGDVKYMNDRHEEIYGWSRDILTNRSIFFEKVFPEPEFREKMQAQIMADMESGDPERMRWNDLKIVTSTGNVRYVYAHNIPLLDQNLMISTVQDITERKLAEEKIKTSLKEKEILLRELYHRTKNNIQVIASMLQIQALSLKNQQVTDIFKKIETKMLGMALVHQKLYESNDLSHINLKDYIEGLVSLIKQNLVTSSKQIEFSIVGEDIQVLFDTAMPIGMVINEIVTNAIEHAFSEKQKGRIEISLSTTQKKELVLEISDNGVGLPENYDNKKDGRFGLKIITDLVEYQLQGEISFKNKKGLNTRIVIKEELYETRV